LSANEIFSLHKLGPGRRGELENLIVDLLIYFDFSKDLPDGKIRIGRITFS
jgi:hypothetical protein